MVLPSHEDEFKWINPISSYSHRNVKPLKPKHPPAKSTNAQASYFYCLDLHFSLSRILRVTATKKTNSVCFTTKGQVVIPAWLRSEFHIEKGTRAIVQATPEGILLKPVTAASIRRLRGILKAKPGEPSFARSWAEHKADEKRFEEEKYGRSTGSR
jgi:AbrB family looped-hinge helix DNA binding protein